MTTMKRLLDFGLAVVVAVILVIAYVVYLFSLPAGTTLDWKRVAFASNAIAIVGFLVYWCRAAWRSLWLWVTIAIVLLANCSLYWIVLRQVDRVPLIYYTILLPIELLLSLTLLSRFGIVPKD
jgi:hypothetical protein